MDDNNCKKSIEFEGKTLNDRRQGFFGVEQIEPMFTRGRRDWSVDVLRCFSCFLVCAIHSTNMIYHSNLQISGEDPWLHLEIYRMAFASPTVLFVMVTGIFFLSPERNVTAPKVWKKNVIKMTAAYIFWSLIYAIYRIHMMDPHPDVTFDFLLEQWIVQPAHLWYIPMIVGLYIICPIIRPITATYDRKLFFYIIVIFLGGMILWTMYNWPPITEELTSKQIVISYTPMELICQFPFWMLFGWIAYTYRPTRGFRYLIYFLGITSTALGMYINMRLGIVNGDYFITAVTQKFSIFVFFKNIAIFYFIVTVFREYRFSKGSQLILRKLSDSTLIIYLIHSLILKIMHDNSFLYGDGMSPWIGVWIYAIIAYIAGGLIAVIFHMAWDPMRKVIFGGSRRCRKP